MATLTVWENFKKRENSTKTPTTAGTNKTVYLKENVSISNPIFILNEVNTNISYCRYDGKYYFINDIVVINSKQAEYHASIDVLATYKSDILSTSAFVKYHSHNNAEIVDNRLSTKTSKTYLENSAVFDTLGTVSTTNGAVVLMVNGRNSVGAYAISQNELEDVLASVDIDYTEEVNNLDFSDLENAPDIIDWLTRFGRILGDWFAGLFGRIIYSGSAIENIRSAHMLPLSLYDIGNTERNLYLGSFDTRKTALRIDDRIFTDSATVNIPWQTSDWRRNTPYTELFLYIPYVGLVQLSPSDLVGETTITVGASIDKLSGDAIFYVYTGSGARIGHYTTNVSSDYPIGASNVSSGKATGGVISSAIGAGTAIAGLATGGSGALIVGGAVSAGVGLVNAINPTNTSIGGATGGAVLGLSDKSRIKCYSILHDTTVPPANVSAVFGTPTNAVVLLSTITGYVQTVGASVDCDAELQEKTKINSMLDNGIYIE